MNKITSCMAIFALVFATAFSSFAQVNILSSQMTFRTTGGQSNVTTHHGNLAVNGSGTGTNVLIATNTSTATQDRFGLNGISKPAAYYGIGVGGEGGYIGVQGLASMGGTGGRYGLYGSAAGGSSYNYGVFGAANGTNAFGGYFNGNVYCTGQYQTSDKDLKKNIEPLSGSLEKIMKLSAKTFEFDVEKNPDMGLSTGIRIGLIAQDVETIFPELVKDVPVAHAPDKKTAESDSTDYIKAINYTELIPVLVNAIQEQQKEIDNLKKKLSDY